jgi:intracellular septation protein
MKLLFDFLPILLFFGTYKYAEAHKDWAAAFATEHFGFMVSGGMVGVQEAPVLLSTLVVIVATALQVAWLKARGKKIDTMLWVSLGLIVVLGGATVWFHNETFIKWKPSVLYWVMALALWASANLFGKDILRKMIGDQLKLPDRIWKRLTLLWCAFFAVMGVINILVAYNFSTDSWVNYKLFGGTGLMIIFMIGQGLYVSRHIEEEEDADADADAKPPKA